MAWALLGAKQPGASRAKTLPNVFTTNSLSSVSAGRRSACSLVITLTVTSSPVCRLCSSTSAQPSWRCWGVTVIVKASIGVSPVCVRCRCRAAARLAAPMCRNARLYIAILAAHHVRNQPTSGVLNRPLGIGEVALPQEDPPGGVGVVRRGGRRRRVSVHVVRVVEVRLPLGHLFQGLKLACRRGLCYCTHRVISGWGLHPSAPWSRCQAGGAPLLGSNNIIQNG